MGASETGLILCFQSDICRDFSSHGCCHPCQLPSKSCYGQCNPNTPGISCQRLGNNTEWKDGMKFIVSNLQGQKQLIQRKKQPMPGWGPSTHPLDMPALGKDYRGAGEIHGKDFCGYLGNWVQRVVANDHILSSKMYLELQKRRLLLYAGLANYHHTKKIQPIK